MQHKLWAVSYFCRGRRHAPLASPARASRSLLRRSSLHRGDRGAPLRERVQQRGHRTLERRALDPHALSRGFATPASPRRESPTMRTRSLLRNAALALGAAFALSATLAHADPAHYFVVH